MTSQGAGEDLDLFALDKLAGLLQGDLRIELIILTQQLNRPTGNLPADLIEIKLQALENGLTVDAAGLVIDIQTADPDRRLRDLRDRGHRKS